MATEITTEQYLAAILDAQNRCNNLIGAAFNHLREQLNNSNAHKEAHQLAVNKWKVDNPELSKRCGDSLPKLNKILHTYIGSVLDAVDELEDTSNDFQVREFVDRFGPGFAQLSSMIQAINTLSS